MSDIISPRIKKDLPTAEYVRSQLSYAPETGVLRWLKSGPSRRKSLVAGTITAEGYLRTHFNNHFLLNHRLAWFITYGYWPTNQIDHINGDRADNRLCNLREVDNQRNTQNRVAAHSNNISRLLGVRKRKQRFMARILVNGTPHHLGTYPTAEEAHAAYLQAKRSLHPGCTL